MQVLGAFGTTPCYGQPYPQYSTLKCTRRDTNLQIDIAAWYSVTLSDTSESVRVIGIGYRKIEDL
jgi:hypothetical protein